MVDAVPSSKRLGRPRAMKDNERRQIILKAAYDAFVQTGFAHTTTAEIAKRAKISKRTIYTLFSSKESLFLAVIHEHQYLILDLPRPEGETLPLLNTLIRIFRLDNSLEEEKSRENVLKLIVRESIIFPELSDLLYEHEIIRSREALVDWLQYEIDNKRIPDGDVSVYAGMLMDIVFGALLPRKRLKDDESRELRKKHIKERLVIFLRGISAL